MKGAVVANEEAEDDPITVVCAANAISRAVTGSNSREQSRDAMGTDARAQQIHQSGQHLVLPLPSVA